MEHKDDMPFNMPETINSADRALKISVITPELTGDKKVSVDFERELTAMQSLRAGTWTLDISTNSLLICNTCKQILQISGENNIDVGQLRDLIPAGYNEGMTEAILLAIEKGRAFDVEIPVITANGLQPKWLRITGAAAYNNQHCAKKIHGTIADISERKKGELLKEDLIAIVSHDLRSPLSVIKLYIQLCSQMAGTIGNNYILENLKKAGLQVHKMNRLMQSYLESSATNAGKIGYSPAEFEIQELLQEVIGDLCLLYPGHVLFLKPGPCIKVCADRDKITQVLQNLVSNAIKYSSRADVITVHFKKVRNCLQVGVEDHGIGINTADQKKIFDRFYRVKDEKGGTAKGYGVGLYLSKEIIKQHNGDIWLKSEVNKGSKFYFTLPLT